MAIGIEYIRIAILGPNDEVLTFLDNGTRKSLHYYDDSLKIYLAAKAYTFEFKTPTNHEDICYLETGNAIAFKRENRDYYLKIVTVDKTETEISVTAYGTSFEYLNYFVSEHSPSESLSLEEYVRTMDSGGRHPEEGAMNFHISVNDVSTEVRRVSFSEETVLSRLFSIAHAFGAELEINAVTTDNHKLLRVELSFRRKTEDDVQGIGSDRRDEILRYGKEIESIHRTSDITELITAIRPVGSGGVSLYGWNHPEFDPGSIIYDKEGNILYELVGSEIRAPQSRDRFPIMIDGLVTGNYIVGYYSGSADNEYDLYMEALAELKQRCIPKLTYEIEGYVDAEIGDRFTIEDNAFTPTLYVEARVVEQKICFTDPTKNQTTFDNFTELKAEVDPDLIKMMEKLKEDVKPYFATITVANGTELEEPNSMTDLTINVEDDTGLDVTSNFRFVWYKEGARLDETTRLITIQGWDINGESATYKCDCYLNGVLKASAQCIMFCRDNLLRVELYYLLSDQDNGIQWDDPRWSTQMVEPTAAKPYVWSLAKHIYSKSDPKYIGPSISRKYAPPGEPGRGITLMVHQFFLSISTSEPIGVNDQNEPVYPDSNSILLSSPQWEEGKYLWTRTVIYWTTGDPTATEWVLDSTWMQAYDAYAAIQDRLEAAETVITAYLDPDSFSEMIKTVVSKEWFESELDEEGNPLLDDDGNPIKLSVDDKIKALAKQGTEFTQTHEKFEMVVENFTTQLKKLDGDYQGFIEQFNKRFTFDSNGLTISAIVGEGENSVNALLKLVLDNDDINIVHTGSNSIASSFGANTITTNRGEFKELDIEPFGFRRRANGGLSFKKVK